MCLVNHEKHLLKTSNRFNVLCAASTIQVENLFTRNNDRETTILFYVKWTLNILNGFIIKYYLCYYQ